MNQSADPETVNLSPVQEFIGDLRAAFNACRLDPRLPLSTLVLYGLLAILTDPHLTARNPFIAFVSWVPLLFSLGFNGTQRVWFLRIFRGKTLSPREAWGLSWRFCGRFFALALLVGGPFMVLVVVYIETTHHARFSGAWMLVIAIVGILFDVLLTFVTPALAFNTRRATTALAFGLRMIVKTWPAAAVYVLFPPLALQLALYQPESLLGANRLLIEVGSVVAALVSLVFKGAVTAFYLRYVAGVGDDGAADFESSTYAGAF